MFDLLYSQRRKFAAIEFDNRLLLERLAKIVQKKTIDNEIHAFIEEQKVFKAKLAQEKKQTVAHKITDENRRLLQRIQEVPPVYNHIEWEEQARERENIVKTMVLYPEFYQKRVEESKMNKKLPSLDTQYREVMGSRGGSVHSLSGSHKQRSFTAPSSSMSTLDGTTSSFRYVASK